MPEASVVVQQYAQTTHADRLVALIRMGDRIVLIVRSRSSSLSAARLASRFGGGGHATAASAVVRDRTLIEALCGSDILSFWRTLREVGNRYNVCGLSPLALLLEILPGRTGRQWDYEMWMEGRTQSAVSFAAIGFD